MPTLKHFPGLGAARANTDRRPVVIEGSLQDLRIDYEPYRQCGDLAVVMVSNARYAALDGAGGPAVFSEVVYERELRGVTGFDGVTISDDLEAAALADESDVAVRALRAGLHLQLYARSEAASATAHGQLIDAVDDGRLGESRVQAAARVLELKDRLGEGS